MKKLTFVLSFSFVLVFKLIAGDAYFIDVADESTSLECLDDCPESVGRLVVARPMQIRDIQDSSDIQVSQCMATLIESDLVMTAAHCTFNWTLRDWEQAASGDCSKVFGFYLPNGERARCQELISLNEASPDRLQIGPDTFMIRLDRHLNAAPAVLELNDLDLGDHHRVSIWGESTDPEEKDKIVKRTCRPLKNSILAPAHAVGLSRSAHLALECDGDIVGGWSGAGVFYDGQHIGAVSQAISQTGHHAAQFGINKAIISLNACDHHRGDRHPDCVLDREVFQGLLEELYFGAVDFEHEWIARTQKSFERNFPGVTLEYVVLDSPHFPRKRGYQVIQSDFQDDRGKLEFIEFDFSRFHPKFVRLNSKAQITGLYNTGSIIEPGLGGRFYLPLIFHWR